jgi:hypothetical protein
VNIADDEAWPSLGGLARGAATEHRERERSAFLMLEELFDAGRLDDYRLSVCHRVLVANMPPVTMTRSSDDNGGRGPRSRTCSANESRSSPKPSGVHGRRLLAPRPGLAG